MSPDVSNDFPPFYLTIMCFICWSITVGEPCELPYFELDGEILNPGANQPYYFESNREYQMSCNEGFVIQLGEGESYLWTCVKGNWTTTAKCVGKFTNLTHENCYEFKT